MHENDDSTVSVEDAFTQLATYVADQAFETLEEVRTPDQWMNDDDTQVTLTRSVSDWTYFFLGLQTLMNFAVEGHEGAGIPGGDHRTALHVAHILSELAGDITAAVQPVGQPEQEQDVLATI